MTTAGVFRTTDGKTFNAVPGSPESPTNAELLADGNGTPILEVKMADGVVRWDGASWDNRRRALLSGGKFLAHYRGEIAPAPVRSPVKEVDGNLIWEEAGQRRTVRSPRPGLSVASTLAMPHGQLYVGTAGDGLFLFEP